MLPSQVVPGLWTVPLDFVNAFLVDTRDGLILIDTGFPGCAPRILNAIREIGREAENLRQILVTHSHSDHAGSLAELKRLTGATAAMHPVDAALVRAGESIRPLTPAPGLVNALVCKFLVPSTPAEIDPAEIEVDLIDDAITAGGLRAIHVPGHCAGQVAFLWPEHGGVLFAADAAANAFGLALSPLYEDLAEGRRSLAKLSSFDFQVACFGHGKALQSEAASRFRKRWPARSSSPQTA